MLRALVLMTLALVAAPTAAPADSDAAFPNRRVVAFDWDRSGTPTRFTFFADRDGRAVHRLIVDRGRPWSLSQDDWGWGPPEWPPDGVAFTGEHLAPDIPVRTAKQAYSFQHSFFVAGKGPHAPIYLVLIGLPGGIDSGGVTVLTPGGPGGAPRPVFSPETFELDRVVPAAGGILIVGHSGMSEAWAPKNAESYDPLRVYVVAGGGTARYDPALSRAYSEAHYCEWKGPDYDEHYAAVGPTTGARHCRAMTQAQFDAYAARHAQEFR